MAVGSVPTFTLSVVGTTQSPSTLMVYAPGPVGVKSPVDATIQVGQGLAVQVTGVLMSGDNSKSMGCALHNEVAGLMIDTVCAATMVNEH